MTPSDFAFDPAIVAAVLHHMNDDHAPDNLLIAQAFGDRGAATARMVGVDGHAGHWVYSVTAVDNGKHAAAVERELRLAWSTPISERAEIRREIVALHDRASAELGIEVVPFSRLVRDRSAASHRGSEGASFMGNLLKGEANRDDYIALVSQHWAIYDALEGAEPAMRDVPLIAPFLSPALARLPALESDLAFLIGDDWHDRLTLMPATVDYAARIRGVAAEWPAGYIAHHYTRYLGDLSGGLHIGRIIARQFGFDTNGIGFYLFDHIADPAAFKDAYRHQLDAAHWGAGEQDRVIDEVLRAYEFNTRVFEQLGERSAAA